MARLELYLTHPLAEAVGWALLHSLWQGALVALLFAVGVTLLRGRNPQLHYLLGCAALVFLIALPVVTGVMLYDPGVQTRTVLLDLEPVGVASAERIAPRQGEVAAAPTLAAPSASFLPDHFTTRLMITLQTSAPWLAAVWLVGVVLLLLRLLGQALYVHRFRTHHQTPADMVWQARARALASRLGVRHAWRLVQSDRTDSPLTFGVLRPLIVLPTSAITGMPAAQLEAVLAHELAHIKRHDYLVNLVQCVVETLLFYHPAVWWVSGEVRRAREECCDDVAVSLCGDAKLYARALTNLETLRQRPPALTLGANDKPLLGRARRLLGLDEARYTLPLATGVILLVTVVVTFALLITQPPVAAQNVQEEKPVLEGVLTGRVFWYNTPLANTRVELRTPAKLLDEGTCCKPQRTLRTTTTDESGAYRFEGVPFGTYALRAVPAASVYQPTESQTTLATSYAELYVTLRVGKHLRIAEPFNTTGVSLTPTLRWQRVPGAAQYGVTLFNAVTGKFVPIYVYLTTTSLKVEKPLEQNTLYYWSVTAYSKDHILIASSHELSFSTSP